MARCFLVSEGKRIRCAPPFPEADHAVVDGACPKCTATPFKVAGMGPTAHDHAAQLRLMRAALLDAEDETQAIDDYADMLPAGSSDMRAIIAEAKETRQHLQFARYQIDRTIERLVRHEAGVIR